MKAVAMGEYEHALQKKLRTLNHFAVVEEVFVLYLRDITSVPVPDYSSTERTLHSVCSP